MDSSKPKPAENPTDAPPETQTSAPPKKDQHRNHKHAKRNFFKSSKHGKKQSEEAPLLVDDVPAEMDDAEIADHSPTDDESPMQSKASTWLQNAGRWIWRNLMVVCIVILLIGGVVALAIYFAGKQLGYSLLLCRLP